MPAQALSFRAVCGCFHPILINILGRKATLYAAKNMKVLMLRTRAEGCILGCVLTLMFWGSLLLRAGDVETNPGPGPVRGGSSSTGGGGSGRGGATVQTRLSTAMTGRNESPDRAGVVGAGVVGAGVVGAGEGGTWSGGNSGCSLGSKDNQIMMEMMKEMFKNFSSQQDQNNVKVLSKMSELEANINSKFDVLKKEVETMQMEIDALQHDNDELRLTCDVLNMKVGVLEQRADDQEARSKRNNLLFFGLKRDENESAQASEDKVKTLIKEKLGMTEEIVFDRVHRLGGKPGAPLIGRCTFYKDKINVLKNKGKLNGTGFYIKEDFPTNVRDIRKKLNELVKENREKGEKVKIVYDHVYIENKKYGLNQSHNGLSEIR